MNRIHKVYKYMIRETTQPVLVFYLVIVLVSVLGVSMKLVMPHMNYEFDGMRLATTIFLFVTGLNSFKSSYLFLQANGVTRRHFYAGGLLAIATAVVAVTAIDSLLYGLLRLFVQPEQKYTMLLLYPNSGFVVALLWTLAFNLLAAIFGWFLTMLYYRSNKYVKIAISVSPAIVMIVLPILSSVFGGGNWLSAMAEVFLAVMGLAGTPNAWIGMITMLVAATAFAGLSFLLVRRAPIKEQDR